MEENLNLETEQKELDDLSNLEIKDLILHKNWKGKIIAYQKLEEKLKGNDQLELEYNLINNNIKKIFEISLPEVQKNILSFFIKNYNNENFKLINIIKNNFQFLFKVIIDKYYSSLKVNIKDQAFELLNIIFQEIEKSIFLENLNNLLGNNLKINTSCYDLIIKLVEKYGFKKFDITSFINNIDKLINSSNSNLRNKIIYLLKLIVRFYGTSILKQLKNIKSILVTEIEKYYEENKNNKLEADISVDNDGNNDLGKKPKKDNYIDMYEISNEEKIFNKYNDNWFDKLLKSPKWSIKKQLLDELIKDTDVPKIASPSNPSNLISFLKKICIDNNNQVKVCGIKIIGNCCKGLRKKFTGILKSNINILLTKLKEKNQLLNDSLFITFENSFYCLDIVEYCEDIKVLIKTKNSYLNSNILKLLKIYYNFNKKIGSPDKNIKFLDVFSTIFIDLLKDKEISIRKQTDTLLKEEIDNEDNNDELIKKLLSITNLKSEKNSKKINLSKNNNNKKMPAKSHDKQNINDIKLIFEKINNNPHNIKIQKTYTDNLISFLEAKNVLNLKYFSDLNNYFKSNYKNPNKNLQKSSIKVLKLICSYYFCDFNNLIKTVFPDYLINIIDKNNDIACDIKNLTLNLSKIKELKSTFIFSIYECFKNNLSNKELKIELLNIFDNLIELTENDNKITISNLIINSIGDKHNDVKKISKKIGSKFIKLHGIDILINKLNKKNFNISKFNEINTNINSLKSISNINNLNNSVKTSSNFKDFEDMSFKSLKMPDIKLHNNLSEIIENKSNNNLEIDKLLDFKFRKFNNITMIDTFLNFDEPKDDEINFINFKWKEYFKFETDNPFNTYESEKLINLIENIMNKYSNYKEISIKLFEFIYYKIYDCSRIQVINILFRLYEKLIFQLTKDIDKNQYKLIINILLLFKIEYNRFNQLFNLISNNFDHNDIFEYIINCIEEINFDSYINSWLLIIDFSILKYKNSLIIKESHILILINKYNNNIENKKISLIFEKMFNIENEYFLSIIKNTHNSLIIEFHNNLNFKPYNKEFWNQMKILIDLDSNFENENYVLENITYYSNAIIDVIELVLNLNVEERLNNFSNYPNDYQTLINLINKILVSNFFCTNISEDNVKNIIKNIILLLYQSKIDIDEMEKSKNLYDNIFSKYSNFNIFLNKIIINFTENIEFNLVLKIIFELWLYFNLNENKFFKNFINILIKLLNKHMSLFIEKINSFDFVKSFEIYNSYNLKLESLREELEIIINKTLSEIKENEEISKFVSSKMIEETNNNENNEFNMNNENNENNNQNINNISYNENEDDDNSSDKLFNFLHSYNIESFNKFLNVNFNYIKENYKQFEEIISNLNNEEKLWNFRNLFNI